MENQKVMNRWLVVVGAILIQLALGAIYAWSVFTPKLTSGDGVYQFSESVWCRPAYYIGKIIEFVDRYHPALVLAGRE